MEKPSNQNDQSLVVAATYASSFDANIALTKLADAGIPAVLNNQIWAGVMGVPTAQFDAIRLLVFKRDLSDALVLLKDTE